MTFVHTNTTFPSYPFYMVNMYSLFLVYFFTEFKYILYYIVNMNHIIWLKYFYLVSRIYINSKVYKVNCTSVATEYSIVFCFRFFLPTSNRIRHFWWHFRNQWAFSKYSMSSTNKLRYNRATESVFNHLSLSAVYSTTQRKGRPGWSFFMLQPVRIVNTNFKQLIL